MSRNQDQDIIFQSTYENIKEFIKGKNITELSKLYMYIMGSERMNRPPNDLEKSFIKEFFTHEAWAEYLQYYKRKMNGEYKYFTPIPPFDLPTIAGILSFEIMQLLKNELSELATLRKYKERKQKERKDLKSDLKTAINDSYDDGVFYKVDGWCNVAEVLERNKLITLTED